MNLSRRNTCGSFLDKHAAAGGLVAPINSDREVRCCSIEQKIKKRFKRWRLRGRALGSGGVLGSELGGAHNSSCVITWCDHPSKLVTTYSTCMSYVST